VDAMTAMHPLPPPGVSLDAGPPAPTPRPSRSIMMGSPEGAGPARSPQIMALQFTQQLVQSAQALGSVLPMLAAPMSQLSAAVQQLVAQAMAEAVQPASPTAPPPPGPPMLGMGGGPPGQPT